MYSNNRRRPSPAYRSRSMSPQMREKLRRQRLRQKKLRQRRIRRNRLIAAFVLCVFIFALVSFIRLLSHFSSVWSMDAGNTSSPGRKATAGNENNDGPDGGNNRGNNGNGGLNNSDAEDIYNLKNIDAITLKRVSDYREGINIFGTLTLGIKDLHKGDLVLINEKNPLPADFVPGNLVNMWENRKPGVVGLKDTSMLLNENAISTVYQMFEEMDNDGAGKCVIVSAYRTVEYQQKLLDDEIQSYLKEGYSEKEAMARALEFIAKPGRSEHNFGYAIDVSAEGENGHLLTGDFELTPQGKWLKENSWKFGYIIRYPGDKIPVTGIGYEPWHLRYLGYPHAAVMKKLNMCLEEYIDYVMKEKSFDVYIDGQASYRIYYIGTEKAIFEDENGKNVYKISVPDNVFSQDASEKWSVSGNGMDGFIVTVKLS